MRLCITQISDSIGPETRFFLLRFFMTDALGLPGVLRVEDVAKKLVMGRSQTGKALKELTEARYLSVTPVAQPGKGRPKSRYDVTTKLKAALDASSTIPLPHHRLIESLIAPDKGSSATDRRHQLKIPSRLLLATLLALSDEKGVVRDAGISTLVVHTGMGPDRIRNHISKLRELGYIRRVVPGVSSSRLFGTVGSAYILNLKHDSYRESAYSGTLWLITLSAEDYRQLPFEAHRLVKLARTSGGSSLQSLGQTQRGLEDLRIDYDPQKFHSFASRLIEANPYRLAPRLQFELEMTASKILSELGETLSSATLNVDEQIQEQYFGASVAPKKLFEGEDGARTSLLNVLYRIAWQMAKERRDLIASLNSRATSYLLHHPPGKLNPMTQLPGSKYFAVESICDATEKSSIVDIAINPDQPHLSTRTEFGHHSLESAISRRFGLG